jgi:hypothetical protein
MSINDQIRKLEQDNFKQKPLNRPVYINPFLLKSDAQILTDIYNKKKTPPVISNDKLNPDGTEKNVGGDAVPPPAPDNSSQQSTPADEPSAPTSDASSPATTPGNLRGGGTAPEGGSAADAPLPTDTAPVGTRQGVTTPLTDAGAEAAAGASNDTAHAGNRDNAGATPARRPGNPNAFDDDPDATTATPATTPAEPDPTQGTSRLGEGDVSDLPNENIIANSPGGAGNTMAHRMRTASANFNNDGVTLRSANTQVTATHPPIVPVTDRITNNVGISNSLLSSLYDKLPASSKTKLTTRAGSSGFLSAAQHPELQTIFPAKFRRNHQVQTYRMTSAGNVYAYVYGGQSRPIYIGNWRESYGFNHPPAYQPANPHGTTARPAPVSTQLGNTGTRDPVP